MTRFRPLFLIAALALFGVLILTRTAAAAPSAVVVHVSNTDDAGPGSLREAVTNAEPGTEIAFNLAGCPCEIALTSSELVIDKNLTITGPGADQLTISGSNTSRVLLVSAGTLFHAPAPSLPPFAGVGSPLAGVLNPEGWRNPERATLVAPTVEISGVTLANGSSANGGGIYNEGTLTLSDAGVENNTASGQGGGIYNASGATLGVLNTLIAHNNANGNFGGGLANIGNASATLTNVTLSDNYAADDGGAIYNNDSNLSESSNAVVLFNVTITDNHTPSDAGGIDNYGSILFTNTIIAGNTAPGFGPDCRNPFGHPIVSGGNNLVGDNSDCTFVEGPGDMVGTGSDPLDPRLAPLANNGGTTQTHALLGGSAALNLGTNSNCPAADQRNQPRPTSAACDIGAYEQYTSGSDLGIFIWDVKLNQSRTPITVAPGATILFSLKFQIWEPDPYCPGCISQLIPGYNDTALGTCIYDGGPGVLPGHTDTSYASSFTAPQTAGTYTLRVGHDWQFGCNSLAIDGYSEATSLAIATFVVTGSGSTIVTNTDDSGEGSLRQAIMNANTGGGSGTISFDIPGNGVQTISLASPLPSLTAPAQLDGLTQPGAGAANLLIALDGTNAGGGANGIELAASSATVRGLSIENFQGDGIRLSAGASDNLIEHNQIANNGQNGVGLVDATNQNNRIHENSIHDNGGLGIDLDLDGATLNDAGDGDVGANGAQNSPVLIVASPSGNDIVLKGRINSAPGTTYALEFFANTACGTGAVSQGETFLSSANAQTDAVGNLYFSTTLANVPAASFITATATDAAGNTSEFSTCIPITANNTSWINAQFLNVPCPDPDNPPPAEITDQQSGYLVQSDQARWFKFCVTPRSKIIITLTQLPADFDLTMFKDIGAQYESDLQKLQNSSQPQNELTQLGAEFAPDAFSPDAYSPDAYSPEAFSPDAYSPDAFSPDAYSPDAYSPDAYSPDAYSPDAYSPDAYSPDAYSPDAYSPDAYSPDAYSPDAYSPDMFSPDAYSSAQSRSVIGVSAFPGTASEGLVLNTWDNTGEFYIRVRGKNGAFNANTPFKITITQLTGSCGSVSLPTANTSLGGASNKATLILWDRDRIEGTGAQKDLLETRLNELAAATDGVVVDTGNDAKVAQMNAQADAKADCPFAKNLVAGAIKDVIDAYDANHNLQYIVLVGNDDVVPFFRQADQALLANESNYAPPVRDSTASQSSLRLGYVLTQDPYGARTSLSLGTNTFAVPEIAVGRLVETASEATGMIDAFLATNGTISLGDGALVTGYDFLADAADAVKDELNAGMNQTATTLIAPNTIAPADPQSWNADDLRNVLLDSPHDIIFLAGHFSAGSTLAADYSSRVLASEIANSSTDFTNALIFSAGCHSGYNIVDAHAVTGVTQQPDWAQAFARKKATLIAGTGYQYGDTDIIEYSERLYLEFAKELRRGTGAVSIGQALVRAKQNYLAATPQLKGIHQKALLQATIFGLPMMSVNMPGARLGTGNEPSIVGSTTTFATNPGQTLGLAYADVTIQPALTEKHTTLTDISSNTPVQTTFYEGSDGVVTNPTQPVLPLETRNVTVNNTVLRGVGFRGGAYSELANIVPLTGAPATEIRGVHVPFPTQVWFPIRTWNVNYFDALGGGSGKTRLHVTPAQYKSNENDPLHGTWRTFDTMQLRLYYSANTMISNSGAVPALSAAPSLSNIDATSDNGTLHFSARAVGNPAAGIQQVWITYTGLSGELNGQWQSLDLVQNSSDSTLWEGSVDTTTPPQDVRFMVQAVNGVGLVSLAANLGAFYAPDGFAQQPQRAGTELAVHAPANGSYGNLVNVSATLTNSGAPLENKTIWFGIGSQRVAGITNANGVAQGTVSLFGLPGNYQLQASFDGDLSFAQSSAESDFDIVKENTHLNIGAPTGPPQYSDPSGFSATVRDSKDRALGQVSVAFVLTGSNDGASRIAITDLVSRAELDTVPVKEGTFEVAVSFGQKVTLHDNTALNLTDSRYNGSSASAELTVSPETATVAYTGDTAIQAGLDLQLGATVTQEDDGFPGNISKAKVKYQVLDENDQEVAAVTDDADKDGMSEAVINNLPGGTYTLRVTVVGGYFASSPLDVPIQVNGDVVALSQNVKLRTNDGKLLTALEAKFKADGRNSGFKLTATKPGTFKYIATLNNTGNVALPVAFALHVPSSTNPAATPAFCLTGADAVQVFSDSELTRPVTDKAKIELHNADSSAQSCASDISVDLNVPAGGKRFVTLEFEFAGKGATGFTKDDKKKYAQGLLFHASAASELLPQALTDTTGIIIVGDRLTGVGGLALNADGTARAGFTVRVRDGKKEIGSAQTDANGFFVIRVPAGGPYKVQLIDPNTNQVIANANVASIVKNEFESVSFTEQ